MCRVPTKKRYVIFILWIKGRLEEAKVHSPGQVTVVNGTLGRIPFRVVRPEGAKVKIHFNILIIKYFYFCPYRAKGHAVRLPRVSLLRRLPWARDRLAFQVALVMMCPKISCCWSKQTSNTYLNSLFKLLFTASFVKVFRSITLLIWKYYVQKVKIFLFLQNIALVMMRWLMVRAERGEITTKSEVRKTIFEVKFRTSKVVFLTFEVIFAFLGTKNRGDRQASPFVPQRYNKIERNPNSDFWSYPQVRVVYPQFCNPRTPKCLLLCQV